MTTGEFDDVVEPYRHGPTNYLFLDLHVGILRKEQAIDAIDPWDVVTSTTQSSDGQ